MMTASCRKKSREEQVLRLVGSVLTCFHAGPACLVFRAHKKMELAATAVAVLWKAPHSQNVEAGKIPHILVCPVV
jgi:hypothetical protein